MAILTFTLEVDTGDGIALHDITPQLRGLLSANAVGSGFVAVSSRHTTTALIVNEYESRLLADVRAFLTRLVPPCGPYQHNDIDLRDCPPDEPRNAHSHLAAMLLGSSEIIAVQEGQLVLGQYQSLILCELDGPRRRRVGVQIYSQ